MAKTDYTEISSPAIKKEVERYVKSQCKRSTKVIHAKPEQTYQDLGFRVTIWNVKTDKEGSWWVANGDLPMNLYPQDQPYFFSTDEAFSFHLGLMLRLMTDKERHLDDDIDFIANGTEIIPKLRRKLQLAAEKSINAIEIEEIQSIGVICRETLIELIGYLFEVDEFKNGDQFKQADVKNRGELVISKYLSGSENSEVRKFMKNLLNDSWDFSNKITHSSSKTIHEASNCLTMTIATVTCFENLIQKHHSLTANMRCKECGSKDFEVASNDENETLLIICKKCRHGVPFDPNSP